MLLTPRDWHFMGSYETSCTNTPILHSFYLDLPQRVSGLLQFPQSGFLSAYWPGRWMQGPEDVVLFGPCSVRHYRVILVMIHAMELHSVMLQDPRTIPYDAQGPPEPHLMVFKCLLDNIWWFFWEWTGLVTNQAHALTLCHLSSPT